MYLEVDVLGDVYSIMYTRKDDDYKFFTTIGEKTLKIGDAFIREGMFLQSMENGLLTILKTEIWCAIRNVKESDIKQILRETKYAATTNQLVREYLKIHNEDTHMKVDLKITGV